MLSKLLGKQKDTEKATDSVIATKISKMNLTDMRSYVNDRIPDFEACEDGLTELMLRLTTVDATTKKLYISSDDMDSKKKKAFELVLLVAAHKKINVTVVEEIQKFTEVYEDIIFEYDREYKEIYASRFKTVMESAIVNIENITQLHAKMHTLSE